MLSKHNITVSTIDIVFKIYFGPKLHHLRKNLSWSQTASLKKKEIFKRIGRDANHAMFVFMRREKAFVRMNVLINIFYTII